MSLVYLCIYLVFNVISGEAARILAVFPAPSISHQVVFRPLTQELVRRGHEVVVITTDPAFPKGQAPENLTEIDVHDISYKQWHDFVATATGKKGDIYTQMKVNMDLFTVIFEEQVKSDDVQRILQDKNQKFDLLLIEAVVRQALSLSYVYKVPVIQVSSLGPVFDGNKVMGAPAHPLLYPTITHYRVHNLTFWEKLEELYYHYLIEYLLVSHEVSENEMIKRVFGPDIPTIRELSNNVDMLFLGVNPIFHGTYPVPPTIIYMGGLHQNPEKELPQDLKSYLDSSKEGVIYMSFGTNHNPSTLPLEKIQMFIRAFSQLPYDVLWKWDTDELPGKSNNIKIGKWFPQADLLRHPKVKLFITQGGQQSTDEAIIAGVPLIGIPMLGDQWYNAEKYIYHKIGGRLILDEITEDSFREAIKTVIEDESYKNNIKRLGTLMGDQPAQPLERAVWWTEHVLRHGGARHLRAPAANISWAQYLEMELVLTLVAGLLTSALVLVMIIYYLYKTLCRIFCQNGSAKIKAH